MIISLIRIAGLYLLEAETHPAHPLIKATLRFIQLIELLLRLKPMAQLHRGVTDLTDVFLAAWINLPPSTLFNVGMSCAAI
jgi:hypothetical protein